MAKVYVTKLDHKYANDTKILSYTYNSDLFILELGYPNTDKSPFDDLENINSDYNPRRSKSIANELKVYGDGFFLGSMDLMDDCIINNVNKKPIATNILQYLLDKNNIHGNIHSESKFVGRSQTPLIDCGYFLEVVCTNYGGSTYLQTTIEPTIIDPDFNEYSCAVDSVINEYNKAIITLRLNEYIIEEKVENRLHSRYIERQKTRAKKHQSEQKERFEEWKTNQKNAVMNTKISKSYLMTDSTGYIKIGKSVDPERRVKDIGTGNPTITLLAICQQDIESELQEKYKDYRFKREWFKLSSQQIEEIITEYDFIRTTQNTDSL